MPGCAISPALLRSSNLIRVHIRADVGRRGGLSPLVVGPQEEIYAAYLRDYFWRGTGSLVVAAFSLVVGLMALSLCGLPRRIPFTRASPGATRCICMPDWPSFFGPSP